MGRGEGRGYILRGVGGHERRRRVGGMEVKGVRSRSFGTNDSSDPGDVLADLGVDSWVLGSTTWVNAP